MADAEKVSQCYQQVSSYSDLEACQQMQEEFMAKYPQFSLFNPGAQSLQSITEILQQYMADAEKVSQCYQQVSSYSDLEACQQMQEEFMAKYPQFSLYSPGMNYDQMMKDYDEVMRVCMSASTIEQVNLCNKLAQDFSDKYTNTLSLNSGY
jgi:hypothetical protein